MCNRSFRCTHYTFVDESWTRIGFQIFCDTIKNMLVGLSLKHIFSVSTANNFTFSCEREKCTFWCQTLHINHYT